MTRWSAPPEPVGPARFVFPPPSEWPAEDLIALGGDLSPPTIVGAYRRGIFPMVLDARDPDPVLGWWSPDPRGILPLDRLRVTTSLRRSARRFEIRIDTCFAAVMRGCADPSRENGWITEDFIRAYTRLHDLGWAHSVEAFDLAGQLAGGLYGVRIGRLFAGESMFSRQRDASKVALMALVERMRLSGMTLLDVQWRTDHLASLGAIAVSRTDYLALLAEALEPPPGGMEAGA
jgi:leucyl/phenylalanyl-tRNA--protein transferase